MSFVRVPRFARIRHVADRLWHRREMTPQERANRYVSRMPVAVVTASLGGHPLAVADRYW